MDEQAKWDIYRASLLGSFSPSRLSALIATPALRIVPPEPGESQAIKLGLYNLKKVVLSYLLQFRDLITAILELRALIASK
jgi:hypothetical protein